MTPSATIQQIRDVIHILVREGLSDHQRAPAIRKSGVQTIIGIDGSPDLSASMKDETYAKVYEDILAAGAYHIRLIDGAMIQMLYTFEKNQLLSHRLSFFPSPALESYDIAKEIYEADDLFAGVFSNCTVRSPIRFDYSSNDAEYVEVEHPKSHMTIGQYVGCRIPVNGPITPMRFMRFILRNFYNSMYPSVNLDKVALESAFVRSITANEEAIFHVNA